MKQRLATLQWLLLGYTVLVILWGAYVRATGAGAGCGNHWPLCNGEVIPRSPGIETLVELGHRLSSGLLGLFVTAFVIAAFRAFPRGHGVRKGAAVSLGFVLSEALIGAGLVRFDWVAANDSEARVYVMAFHLVNTFFLLAAMTLTAWLAGGERYLSLRNRGRLVWILGSGLVTLLVVGASGAVTALGDTLVLTAGISPADSPVVAKLVAARFYHPTLAVAGFAIVFLVVLSVAPRVEATAGYGRALLAVFALQLGLGAANVYLRAPVWMQLVHLAVSDLIWILLVVFAATALQEKKEALPSEKGLASRVKAYSAV